MYTLEGTILIQNACYFVRMVILIKSRSGSKLGHVASKSRSLVQMIENLLYTIESIVQETVSEC